MTSIQHLKCKTNTVLGDLNHIKKDIIRSEKIPLVAHHTASHVKSLPVRFTELVYSKRISILFLWVEFHLMCNYTLRFAS